MLICKKNTHYTLIPQKGINKIKSNIDILKNILILPNKHTTDDFT